MTAMPTAERLAEAVSAADAAMAPLRRSRRRYCAHYAAIGEDAPTGPQPLNLIHALVSAMLPHLLPHRPRAMVRADRAECNAAAERLQRQWNHLAEEIDLAATLRGVVTDALFGAGVMKVGLAATGHSAGVLHDPGRPFADRVDLDDYLIDPAAARREQAAFEGNRYRLARRDLLAEDRFDPAAVERLPVRSGAAGAIEDTVELIDLWLPAHGVIVTLAGDAAAGGAILAETPYDGPERGPYEWLGFHWLPGQLLPVPPVAMVFDLHVMINQVAAKLSRQAQRQKDLVLFDDRVAEEAEQLREALDGEMVGVQNVDRYRQVSFGGANEAGYRHLEFLFEQFRRIGGNADALAGVSAASPTLGQDELLYAGAAARVEDLRSAVVEFTRRVGRKLAWHLWQEPLSGPATAGDLQRRSEADFLEMHFAIEPHSLAPDTPQRRYGRVLEWFQKVLLPTAETAAEQGRPLDAVGLARMTAGLLNLGDADVHLPPAEGAAATEPKGDR